MVLHHWIPGWFHPAFCGERYLFIQTPLPRCFPGLPVFFLSSLVPRIQPLLSVVSLFLCLFKNNVTANCPYFTVNHSGAPLGSRVSLSALLFLLLLNTLTGDSDFLVVTGVACFAGLAVSLSGKRILRGARPLVSYSSTHS